MQKIINFEPVKDQLSLGAQLKLSQTVESLFESKILKSSFSSRIKLQSQLKQLKSFIYQQFLPYISQIRQDFRKVNSSTIKTIQLIFNNLIEENNRLKKENIIIKETQIYLENKLQQFIRKASQFHQINLNQQRKNNYQQNYKKQKQQRQIKQYQKQQTTTQQYSKTQQLTSPASHQTHQFSTTLYQSFQIDLQTIKQLTEQDDQRLSFPDMDINKNKQFNTKNIFKQIQSSMSVGQFQKKQQISFSQQSELQLYYSHKLENDNKQQSVIEDDKDGIFNALMVLKSFQNQNQQNHQYQQGLYSQDKQAKQYQRQSQQKILKPTPTSQFSKKKQNKQNILYIQSNSSIKKQTHPQQSRTKTSKKTKHIKQSITSHINNFQQQQSSLLNISINEYKGFYQNNIENGELQKQKQMKCQNQKVFCFDYVRLIDKIFKKSLEEFNQIGKESLMNSKGEDKRIKVSYVKKNVKINCQELLCQNHGCQFFYEGAAVVFQKVDSNKIYNQQNKQKHFLPQGYGVLKMRKKVLFGSKYQIVDHIIYNGEWKYGKLHGKGKLTIPNQFFKLQNFIKKQKNYHIIKEYNGQFQQTKLNYEGIIKFLNQDKLIINNQSNLAQKQCTYFMKNKEQTVLNGRWQKQEYQQKGQNLILMIRLEFALRNNQNQNQKENYLNQQNQLKQNKIFKNKKQNILIGNKNKQNGGLRQINLNEVNLRDNKAKNL